MFIYVLPDCAALTVSA